MNNLPSTIIYTLTDLNINLSPETINLSKFIIDRLYTRTLNGIINAFKNSITIGSNGNIYINISSLHTLLRTNQGAASTIWQNGIPGLVSGVQSRKIENDLYISGPDFIGLVDARIQTAIGISKLYLQFIQAAYYTISSSQNLSDVRTAFIHSIDLMRPQLKSNRISAKGITCCEFSGIPIQDYAQVDFAHIKSVATDREAALDINNGVIILKSIHKKLTKAQIQDFAGMYTFCLNNNYSIIWAENYNGQ